jgi:hypothetical protein
MPSAAARRSALAWAERRWAGVIEPSAIARTTWWAERRSQPDSS